MRGLSFHGSGFIAFLLDFYEDCLSSPQNTIAARMAYFPIVGRLDCASTSVEHLGFWQMDGYGVMSMYKSDWERVGG